MAWFDDYQLAMGFIIGPLLFRAWYRKHGRGEPFFGDKVERWSATDENRPPIPVLPPSRDQLDRSTERRDQTT